MRPLIVVPPLEELEVRYEKSLDELRALRPEFLKAVRSWNLRNPHPPCPEVTLGMVRPKRAWFLFGNYSEEIYVLLEQGTLVRLIFQENVLKVYQPLSKLSALDIDTIVFDVGSIEVAVRHLKNLTNAIRVFEEDAKAEAEASGSGLA